MRFLLAFSLAVATQPDDIDVRCGAYCTYASLRALDIPVASFEVFQQQLGPPGDNGYSMAQLSTVARAYGAQTLGVSTSLDNLQRRSSRFACIVRLPPAHFVVLSEVDGEKVVIVDPPMDYAIPSATFQSRWDGTALLISAGSLEPEEQLARREWGWLFWASFGVFVFSLLAGGALWVRKSRC